AVLTISGDLFSDPALTGLRQYSGIEANEQLARNVLDFLSESDADIEPERLRKQIEINLTDFVLGKIQALGENWWTDYIPENIQKRCAGKRKRKGNRCPPEHYLDLIDLKSIMDRQWRYFEPAFRTIGLEGGKEKCLSWMDRLNEIRNILAHPLRK